MKNQTYAGIMKKIEYNKTSYHAISRHGPVVQSWISANPAWLNLGLFQSFENKTFIGPGIISGKHIAKFIRKVLESLL
jgi:hypothetical protein